MVEIDGSYGEGGGQILRTGLALSVLTGRPLQIYNIRGRRKNPGLRPQHILSAMAISRLCKGNLKGAEINSRRLTLSPGTIKGGDFSFDIGSAGSTSMVFQTILPALIFAERSSSITIKGGTHVKWSPPIHYIRDIFLKEVSKLGVRGSISLKRWGFYPLGGGIINAHINPSTPPLKSVNLKERGKLSSVDLLSAVANLPFSIAVRQKDRALKRLEEAGIRAAGRAINVNTPGQGTFIFIKSNFEKVSAGFSALGEKGKPSELVADEAVNEFLTYLSTPTALDPHLTDQIVLYAALAEGSSTFTTSKITQHLLTNIWVIERFLPVKFKIKNSSEGEAGTISVEGIGFKPIRY